MTGEPSALLAEVALPAGARGRKKGQWDTLPGSLTLQTTKSLTDFPSPLQNHILEVHLVLAQIAALLFLSRTFPQSPLKLVSDQASLH